MAATNSRKGGRASAANGVETEKLRQAFEASGLSKRELCRRLDWHRHPGARTGFKGDHRRLNRVLGYTEAVSVKRLCSGDIVEYRYKQKHVSKPVAEKIVKALGIDPVDVDL